MNRLTTRLLAIIFSAAFLFIAMPMHSAIALPSASDSFVLDQPEGDLISSDGTQFTSTGYGCGLNTDTLQIVQPMNEDSSPGCSSGTLSYYWVARDAQNESDRAIVESVKSDNQDPKQSLDDSTLYLVSDNQITSQSPISSSNQAASNFEDRCRTDLGVLSWLLCPIADFSTKITESIINMVLGLLQTEPLISSANDANVMFSAWKVFRTIANSLLVVAFLFIIYLQLSGNQAYQVQKTLPRLVVVVIMIQLSYFVAAIMVDIGNVLGAGITGIFDAVTSSAASDVAIQQIQTASDSSSIQLTDSGYSGGEAVGVGALYFLFGSILAFIAFIPAGLYFGAVLFMLIGIAIAAAFALIALALRQLVIVVMVVVAPIAFLFGVFPQSERWMKEWFDNFAKIILIYPLVAVVFGSAGLLSLLSLQTGASDFNQLFAALIPTIALFSVPLLFRFAGGLFRGVSGLITNTSKRTVQGVKGDPRNPYSWAGRVAYKRHQKRGMRAMGTAGKLANSRIAPSKERTLKVPLKKQPVQVSRYHPVSLATNALRSSLAAREYYKEAADQVEGRLSKVHKDNIHGLFFGDQAVSGWRGALRYIVNPNSLAFRLGEAREFLNDRAKFMATVGPAVELAAGGHPDYASAFPWGVTMMELKGALNEGYAQEWDAEFRTGMKNKHVYMNGATHDRRKAIQQAYAAENNGNYMDNKLLFATMFKAPLERIENDTIRQTAHELRSDVVNDFAGGLSDQQSSVTFEVAQAIMEDSSFLEQYVASSDPNQPINQEAIEKLVGVYKKADGMSVPQFDFNEETRMREASGDEKISTHYKVPADIISQESFTRARSKLRTFLVSRGVDIANYEQLKREEEFYPRHDGANE